LAQIEAAVKRKGGAMSSRDHGNAEMLIDPVTRPAHAHTTNPVPFIVVSGKDEKFNLRPTAPFGTFANRSQHA